MRAAPVPGAPQIEWGAPDVAKTIKPPISIRVHFVPTAPAAINPESLRILYGAFRINITDRVKRAARLTADSISAEGATLPSGTHHLFIDISDSDGRSAEKEVSFTVE